jgi:4-amino-4-deoxy-L-arabinose transferase-like glycosyltransferase
VKWRFTLLKSAEPNRFQSIDYLPERYSETPYHGMKKFAEFGAPILLGLLCAILHLTGLGLTSLIEPLEAVHAEAARRAFLSEHLFAAGSLDSSIPPMVRWLQQLSFYYFGINETAARLPGAIAGIGCILILYIGCRPYLGIRVAFNGGLIFATMTLFVLFSRMAIPASPLLFFQLLSLILINTGVQRSGHGYFGAPWLWGGAVCAGAAALTGTLAAGLVVLAATVAHLTLLIRMHPARTLGWLAGVLGVFALTSILPYLVVAVTSDLSGAKQLLVTQLLFTAPMPSAGDTVVLFVLIGALALVPWLAFLPLGFMQPKSILAADQAGRTLRLMLVIIVCSVSGYLFTSSSSMLLLCLPTLALLLANRLTHESTKLQLPVRLASWITIFLLLFLVGVSASAPFLLPYLTDLYPHLSSTMPVLNEVPNLGVIPYIIAIALFFGTALMMRARLRQVSQKLFELLFTVALIVNCTSIFGLMIISNQLFSQPLTQLARMAAQSSAPEAPIILYAIGDRYSISFTTGRNTVVLEEEQWSLLDSSLDAPDAVALTSAPRFDRLSVRNPRYITVARQGGYVLFKEEPRTGGNIR